MVPRKEKGLEKRDWTQRDQQEVVVQVPTEMRRMSTRRVARRWKQEMNLQHSLVIR